MKVLVLTNMYPTSKYPFYGIFVKEQVESLKKEGIDVDVFFINGRDNKLNYFFALPQLIKKLGSNHYDIVHAHHTYCVYPFWIAKAVLNSQIPLILTFHEGEVLKSSNLLTPGIDNISKLVYSRKIKRWALNRTTLIISVYDGLIRNLNVKGNAIILPPGIDLGLFQPIDMCECREKLNLPINKKILFFPADIRDPVRKAEKGFDILQEALAIVKKGITSKDEIILITGGNISHQDMPIYMNASDVVIQTSNFEASPMVIKEAMACNIPIVSTDVGDTKWLIGDTAGCFICRRTPEDVASKIKIALNYNKRTNGRKHIEELGLGLKSIARQIMRIYEKIIL